MKTLTALLLVLALSGCSHLRETAHLATAADGVTTAVGIAAGAAKEANPLINSVGAGVALVGVRIAATEIANRQDEPTRTNALATTNAITWGVVANNIAVIASKWAPWITSHFAIATGLGFGYLVWEATEETRTLAAHCAMHKETHPRITC